jgi:hypothetical protein
MIKSRTVRKMSIWYAWGNKILIGKSQRNYFGHYCMDERIILKDKLVVEM